MQVEWIRGRAPGFEDAAAVRRAVFVAEQGFENEFDELDGTAWHLVGYESRGPVCAARLYFDDGGCAHFGRIAVLPAGRGRGLGLELLAQMEAKARELGARRALLSAQADKTAFYRKAGFAPTGAESLDEGMPHVEMEKGI